MSRNEDAVILPAPGNHTATVIWLHGLGADGNDFVPIVPELGLPRQHGIKFVFPHAPVQPVTINNGMPMRAWYDILSLTRMEKQDIAGTQASAARIAGLLDAERAAGIPGERLILAGFSQGCAMTLYTGLRYPHRLGGLLALSGYLPLHDRLATEAAAVNKNLPILMCHGQYDPVLPMVLGKSSAEILTAAGYPVDWREYPMQHQVCAEEIDAIGDFLRQRLALG
ncbi:MAG: carboxylesterase [Stagnimonas sp.]|nr:carboxylesterase [Stagnimonas sp.]